MLVQYSYGNGNSGMTVWTKQSPPVLENYGSNCSSCCSNNLLAFIIGWGYNIKNYPGIATLEIYIILHVIQKPNPVINTWPKQLSYQPSAVLNSVDICTTDINYTDISNCLLDLVSSSWL